MEENPSIRHFRPFSSAMGNGTKGKMNNQASISKKKTEMDA